MMLPARVTASVAGSRTAAKTMSTWALVRRLVGRRAWNTQQAEPCPGQALLTAAGLDGQHLGQGSCRGSEGLGGGCLGTRQGSGFGHHLSQVL